MGAPESAVGLVVVTEIATGRKLLRIEAERDRARRAEAERDRAEAGRERAEARLRHALAEIERIEGARGGR